MTRREFVVYLTAPFVAPWYPAAGRGGVPPLPAAEVRYSTRDGIRLRRVKVLVGPAQPASPCSPSCRRGGQGS